MADPTVVALEVLTVFGAGPLCVFLMYQIVRNDPARYYNYIVLSVAELYGGWMTFCPEVCVVSPYVVSILSNAYRAYAPFSG
jgi:EXPERA (EXPanded EBP superfamily)